LIASYQLVFIDEAQRIENIGINLEIINQDNFFDFIRQSPLNPIQTQESA